MDSKICVLGLGYIGLPTASLLAIHGFRVVGVDVNPEVVETVNVGLPPDARRSSGMRGIGSQLGSQERRNKHLYVAQQFAAHAAWEEAGFRVKQLGKGTVFEVDQEAVA